jgi:hypothetical protein
MSTNRPGVFLIALVIFVTANLILMPSDKSPNTLSSEVSDPQELFVTLVDPDVLQDTRVELHEFDVPERLAQVNGTGFSSYPDRSTPMSLGDRKAYVTRPDGGALPYSWHYSIERDGELTDHRALYPYNNPDYSYCAKLSARQFTFNTLVAYNNSLIAREELREFIKVHHNFKEVKYQNTWMPVQVYLYATASYPTAHEAASAKAALDKEFGRYMLRDIEGYRNLPGYVDTAYNGN